MNILKALWNFVMAPSEPRVNVYTQSNGRKAVSLSDAQRPGKPCGVCGSNCGQCGRS